MKIKDYLILGILVASYTLIIEHIIPPKIKDCNYVVRKIHINKYGYTLRLKSMEYGYYRYNTDSLNVKINDTIRLKVIK